MNSTIHEKWDKIYSKVDSVPRVLTLLQENAFLLPGSGTALDLACGLGANACFLAQAGLQTDAWDISSIAIAKAAQLAQQQNVTINTRVCDVKASSLPKHTYDVIVVSRYLDRSLVQSICEALKPNGLLFYQTFTQLKTAPTGPKNPQYLLQRNELLKLFSDLTAVYYRENALLGKHGAGLRNEAQLIAQKST